jgi:phosphoribosylglycinamide formyltransferase-1
MIFLAKKMKTAIFISGRGSNMMSIVEAAKDQDYPASINLVVSNNPDAAGLEFARQNGIKTFSLDHRHFGKERVLHEQHINIELQKNNIEIVCLAGYMRILSPSFVNEWAGKMINIHPSLLPAFTGLHTHKRALQMNVKYHGCTVHVVTEELDFGPIIDQALVHVSENDTEESLEKKVLKQEHILYPKALKKFIENM